MSAWIRVVDEAHAEGRLKEIFDTVRHERGSVANVYRAQALHPETILAHLRLNTTLMHGKSPLTRRERELIATAVSRANASDYCIPHHADALGHHSTEPGLPVLVATDYTKAPLKPRERALLDHCVKLTRAPDQMTRADVQTLRDHGFTDEEILDATLTTAYVNFVNRVANGLGVSHEDVGAPFKY